MSTIGRSSNTSRLNGKYFRNIDKGSPTRSQNFMNFDPQTPKNSTGVFTNPP